MADQDMRLRLVVRRNGLPELRLVWNVQLGGNPTISKLLEQLNDVVPLESGTWGLEDYVVELHDSDGTDFECLHYHLVKSVLRPDDRVFIRALDRDDHRRRRVSGRAQISSDGRHLIDGVPFGRPLLRAPVGRPAVRIPPRKRSRLTYTQQDDDRSVHFLTNANQPQIQLAHSNLQSSTTSKDVVIGEEYYEDDEDDEDFVDTEANESSSSDDEQPLEDDDDDDEDVEEEDVEEEEEEEEVEPARKEDGANESATSDEETEEEEEEDDDDDVPDDEDLQHEVHDLALDNPNLNGQETPSNRASNGETPDKSLALRAAFPMAPAGVCERVLAASNGDIKATYDALSEGYTPQVSREAVITWNPKESSRGTGLLYSQTSNNSTSAQNRESPSLIRKRKLRADSPEDEEDSQDVEGEEHDAGLLRKYDHAGFPPGTITSGNGLAQMAKITSSFGNAKINGTSETTSTSTVPKPTVNGLAKKNTLEEEDDDDDTSSSGSSSSSTSSESSDEADNVNKEDSSSEQTSSESTSSDSSDSDSESSDAKPKRSASGSSTSDSDSDSDSGPEERPLRRTRSTKPAAKTNGQKKSTGSSDDTSDSGTSESDSSSESSSSESSDSESESESGSDSDSDSDSDSESEDNAGGAVHQQAIPDNAASQAKTAPETITPNQSQNNGTQNNATPASVPPGSGKEATKRRNARRRAARVRKQMMNDGSTTAASTQDLSTGNNTQNSQEGDQEAVLFEAKRKALLDALASGGVEVGPSGETIIDQGSQKTGSAKRKRAEDEEEAGDSEQHDSTVAVNIADTSLGDGEPLSPGSQKRRRLDVGATRRLVFGALGVRNPKTKEDEDKLRNQLQNGANQNRSSNAGPPSEAHEAVTANDEEDLESWKAKINYRAVECCSYGVELSAAPFPFQQRWDPQQQFSTKKGKRGGKGKQAQRNDAQYYSEESRLGQKGFHDNSNEFGSNGYDDMYAEEGDHMNTDVILNYDDGEARDTGPVNETSLATDLDDLPSLPKDISVLPILRPGEAQAGMVIAWQKWSCSSATSWQPQLSWVTAIVIKVDDDAAALELCLARRDRYLDGIEKRYDNRTGQRIYDRFEAPDLQEDEEGDMDAGVDDGYRSVFWADLQDPRILQQPLDPTNDDFEAEPQNVESQPIHSVESEAEADTTIIHTQSVQSTGEQEFKSALASSQFEQKEAEGSVVEESSVRAASVSTFHQAGQGHHMADLIFSDLSQISSPSRQLLETASQAMDSSPPPASNNGEDGSPVLGALDSIPLPAPLSSIPRTEQFESDVIAGTPKAAQRQTMDPSSASSIRSAPQPVSESYEVPDSHPGLPPVISSSAPNLSRVLATPGPNTEMDQENVREPVNISPSSSSSSLPSINSIWCSARTSQRDRSPSKAKTSFNSFDSKLGGGMASSQPERSPSKMKTSFNSFESKLGGNMASSQPERSPSKMKTSFNSLDTKLGRDVVSSQLKQSPSKAKTLMNSFESKLGGDVATPRAKRSPAKAKGLSNSFDSKLSRVTATDLSIDDSAKMSSSFPVKLEPSSSQPLTRTRRRSARPFSIPPNSQVVELSSDSEPAFAEHYADDDVDGTYTPVRESLPKGDGWVKKRPDPKRRKGRSL